MKYFTIYFFTALLMVAMSCKPPQPNLDIVYGEVQDHQYINEYFGFTIDLPAGWNVLSKEQIEHLQDMGKGMIAGENKKIKAEIEISDIRTANLLSIFKYELGPTREFNPNLSIVAENIQSSPDIKTGEDYLNHSRKLLEQSQFKYDSISTDVKKITISGQIFGMMFTSVSYMGITIRQEYFSSVINGFSLNILLSYNNDEQKDELEKILNSLKFQ